ncbi:VanZ family protein [Mucilaginibacter mali]|uniref:VanZ family protein n=1 Tax=Mucilaginibacter mali TaxID=2740462 RepID=A0A7D4UN82_9SPHI|nr:VanZ family protein [Mucilaginibacter mali]QKJ31781.1 VanZ family protein [Mucilaginibacter mali]
MKQVLKYQRPALWWALFIFIICNIQFGSVGKSHLFFPGFDKVTHCGLFFVQAVFLGSGFIRQYGVRHFTLMAGIRAFFIVVLYGGIIELLQRYVFTWRSGEWDDLFCDAVGAGMAIFAILVTLYASANAKD